DTAKFFGPSYIEKTEAYLDKHGQKSAFSGRFSGFIRPFISFVAGVRRIDYRRFQIFNFLGAVAFGFVFIVTGFILGEGWQFTALWIDRFDLFIFGAVAVVAINVYVWKIIVDNKLAIKASVKLFFKSLVLAVKENKFLRKWADKHPRLAGFIKRRLSADGYLGIHFTVGFLAISLFLWGFFSVVEDIIFRNDLYLVDLRVVNLMSALRTPVLNRIMLFITDFGEWQMITLLSLIVILMLLRRRKISQLFTLAAGVVGGVLLFSLTKIISHRSRPPLFDRIFPVGGYSFPSGHSVMAVVFYGLLTYFLIRVVKKWRIKAAIFLGGIFFVFLIGLSRVYLGVHYPTDVVGGWMLGFFWLAIIITALEIRIRYFPPSHTPVIISSKKIFSVVIIFLVIFYAVFAFVFYKIREPYLYPIESKTYQAIPVPAPEDIFSVLPKTSETLTGSPMEPISLIFVGSKAQIEKSFIAAGWVEADKITPTSIWKIMEAASFGGAYLKAPMTPSFFNYAINNFGFEKQLGSVLNRHHLRFWQTNFVFNGERIWVVTASFDEGLKYLVVHHITPNIDKERDFVLKDILATGLVKGYKEYQLVSAESGHNQAGDYFYTDGKAYIVILKNN
ncbi:MAG: LssY C-terminal domain-containing protein, partial [Patescibacteria group bacterium]|nr:LssY C-terminal domain-containing protein [Patescibacteria group bacterium]